MTESQHLTCESCGFGNRADASYCRNCGAFLGICPACGVENPTHHRFCSSCGANLRLSAAGERKSAGVIDEAISSKIVRFAEITVAANRSAVRRFVKPVGTALKNPPGGNRIVMVGAAMAVVGQIGLAIGTSGRDASIYAIIILATGAALFGTGSGRSEFPHFGATDQRARTPTRTAPRGTVERFVVVLGVLSFAGLIQALVIGAERGWYVFAWLAAIIALALPFASQAQRRIDASTGFRIREIAFLAVVVGVFVALNVRDLTHWYYSVIGDEYAFYNEARSQLENGVVRPFDQAGVYGKHPVLGTTYQAFVMGLTGTDHFGWKLSSLIAVAVAIPGVYALARQVGGRGIAAMSSALFTSSHYLFAYAHTGYNNIHAIAPTVWALAALAHGLRRNSRLTLYAAGVLAGLGFYTFFSARTAIVVIVAFVLLQRGLRRAVATLVPTIAGFVVTAAPIFVVSRLDTISGMISEIPGGYSPGVTGPAIERIAENVTRNLLAFNFNVDSHHYVTGSLLDPITAVLAVLGVFVALRHGNHPAFRLLLIWLAIGAVTTGILSPYPGVAISRLNFLVPPLSILAAIAVRELWRAGGERFHTIHSYRWAAPIAAAVVLLAVLGLNYNRFWRDSPREFHLPQQAIGLGAGRSDACCGEGGRTLYVGQGVDNPLRFALQSYEAAPGDSEFVTDYATLEEVARAEPRPNCVVFVHPNQPGAEQAQDLLASLFPAGRMAWFTDPSEKGRVLVFTVDAS